MADDFHPKYNIHIEHGEHIAIGDGATLDASQAEALLKSYRQQVLKETRYVDFTGIPRPLDRERKPISLQVPLDRVYIRIQALPEAEEHKAQRAEQEALEAELRHEEGPQPPGGFLNRLLSRRTLRRASQESPPSLAPDPISVLRRLGEYFYRRGEVYRAEDRPQPVDPEAALREHGRMVVLGAPGAGKTTLLRYLARRAAEAETGSIPVLVSLRDYAAYRGAGGKESLQAFALSEAAGGSEQLRQVLEQAAEEGRILWLVDALDEARGWRRRAAREAANLPGQMVLTSRPVGYERAGLEDLPHFETLALTPQAREKFLHDWFTVLAEARSEDEAWVVQRVGWLQTQLEARPRIQPLTRNPLLLTFLVVLAGEEPARELPTTRAALYRQYVEELLMTWEYHRRPRKDVEGEPSLHLGPLSGEAARQAAREGLLRLGWRLHLTYYGGQAEAMPTRRALTGYLEPFFEKRWNLAKGEAKVVADAILDFWEEAGLLVHWRVEGGDYLAFRHLTFQEYAAARTLADLWQESPRRVWRFLRPRLHHYAWREVLLLMAGLLEDATLLVRKVRRAHSPYERDLHRDLFLAAEVAGEGRQVDDREIHRLVRGLSGLLARWRKMRLFTVLALIFFFGLLLSWWSIKGWGALVTDAVWMLLWIVFGSLPRLRALLWLPTRLFGLWNVGEYQRAAAALGKLGDAQAVKPLIRALEDENEDVRLTAAWALGELDDTQAVEPLTLALKDECVKVRWAAAEALGEMGDARAVAPLIRALGDRGIVRRTAAEALGKLGDARAVEPLIRALGDGDERVRKEAAEALGKLGNAAIEPLIHALGSENKEMRRTAAEALGKLGDTRVVEPLIRALGDRDERVRKEAAEALGKLGDAAIEPLIHALGSENKEMRRTAAETLGKLGDARAVEPLIRTLGDENWSVREAATKVLGELGNARAMEPLICALGDENWSVREAATKVLGELGNARAMEPLIRALGDENWSVRWAAAEALSKLGDARVVEPLIRVLKDGNVNARRAAAEALDRLSDTRAMKPLIHALGDEDWNVRWAAAKVLGKLGNTQAVEPLIRALGDKNENVRQVAAKALGKLGNTQAVEPLIRALKDENGDVRRAAAEALGMLEDARTVEPLICALGDEDEDVRRAAAEALGKLGDIRAVKPLRALRDRDKEMYWVAVEALGKLGDTQAVDLLIHALKDENGDVRRAAAEALGKLGNIAIEPLIRVLEDENVNARRAAALILGKLGDVAAAPLIHALEDEQRKGRKAAIKALGEIGDARAVEPLIRALGDGGYGVREAAAKALGEFGDVAVEPLIRALKDKQWEVRKAAAKVLGKLGDDRAVEPLICALKDEQQEVHKAAIKALGEIGDARAMEPLIHALRNGRDWTAPDVVMDALRKLNNIEVESLIRALEDRGRIEHKVAVEALGESDDKQAVRTVKEMRMREATTRMLGERGDERAVEPLIHTLKDKWESTRKTAAEALGKIAEAISSRRLARRAARALWWRLTDVEDVAQAAYTALRRVVARLTELEVAALPPSDPLQPPSPSRWRRAAFFAGGLVLFWLADLLTNLTTDLVSELFGSRLPRGGLGWIAILVALGLGAMTLAEALRRQA